MMNQIISNLLSPNKTTPIYLQGSLGCGKVNQLKSMCESAQISYVFIDLDQTSLNDLKTLPQTTHNHLKAMENKILILSGVRSKNDLSQFKNNKIILVGENCPDDLKPEVQVINQ